MKHNNADGDAYKLIDRILVHFTGEVIRRKHESSQCKIIHAKKIKHQNMHLMHCNMGLKHAHTVMYVDNLCAFMNKANIYVLTRLK